MKPALPYPALIALLAALLAWRRSFTRYEAIAALRNAVYACKLDGVTRLTG
jgi:LysR family hydrogen peroxide-inducible transcriptional activator